MGDRADLCIAVHGDGEPAVTPRLFQCARCRYHYKPDEMVRYRDVRFSERDRYICKDVARCDGNIARREFDREAMKR